MKPRGLRAMICAGAMVAMLAGPGAMAQGAQIAPIAAPAPVVPKGAPNVLVVLNDDVGFGAASTFGGPIPTPAYDALAAQGLRYNRFHTTAMCSPTRAALLTGRNPHHVQMGGITNLSINAPGYTGILPKSAASIGRVLQMNGYSTAWFGKNHVTPEWESTPVGSFDRWPTGLGFDYFYGFMNGASSQWNPDLTENTVPVEAPQQPGYILDRDLADHLIDWMHRHIEVAPDKPFFAYWAPGTAHEPHQAPADWIARFRGRFDQGWDAMREETFARQKAMGIVPQDAVLTPRPAGIPAWSSLSPQEQAVAARLMEVHAAQRAYFDAQFARVVAALKEAGQWDNTLVLYIDGDNGASAEAGPNGTTVGLLNHVAEPASYRASRLAEMGGPWSSENYPAGWAWAMDTPFQYFKQMASHLGGIRDGLVISWPGHIAQPGGVRSQFGYVTDIAPTIYEAAGITPPAQVDGVKQMGLDGVSLLASLGDAQAPTRHRQQYFEMLGNRAFYRDGWLASTLPPKLAWEPGAVPPVKDWGWALYDLDHDFSQSKDVAAQHPAILRDLKKGFDAEARRNGFAVLDVPMMARAQETMRPYWANGRSHFTYWRSERALSDEAFPVIRNRSWSMQVPVDVADDRASGTLTAQGGFPFGWGLYVFDGVPTFLYRCEPLPLVRVSAGPLTAGHHVITLEIRADSAAPGAGAKVRLSIDGGAASETHMPATVPNFFGQEGVGLGRDVGTPISAEYTMPFRFDGAMGPITIDLK
ncbi:arylsulfatase [Novosphingobium terrae]|uniref:arylsulfatase n=1 Tax=Novosphingobium terrae TaxID=2726189 RepID=UPI00197E149B|nr:arylsulfatase [Novosphingobium terrae]